MIFRKARLFFFCCSLTVSTVLSQTQKQYLNPDGTKPVGFSQVVVANPGKTIYLSGQVPFDAAGQISSDFEQQTAQVYDNIQKALVAAGATFADVVKMQIFVVDYTPEKLEIIRKVRLRYIDNEHPPATTLVGVSAFFRPEVKIEIDVIATVD
ncbi:MAG: RidA family protein [Bacteroidetes bacterium HGW-Bacteroidetes-13]|nr:MAG: RidA family protein [Bacteroidetes bacterium HGW-Bacteroidetes-13]